MGSAFPPDGACGLQAPGTAGPPGPAGTGTPPSYAAEIRFGVVMYGGVSLAIYINGVTNELFEMACATPREGVRLDDREAPGTREIYRRLSWLVGNEQLRERYARAIETTAGTSGDGWKLVNTDAFSPTRLAIDVIAGTSAGGINGVFLAKALAKGVQFGALKDLWINEGDIALLLNDDSSYRDTDPPIRDRSHAPASLLNSDRMFAKLHFALSSMQPLPVLGGLRQPHDSPLVDELDLFVTTTDIKGSPVALRLFDKVVYERRYKQNYRFRYPDGLTSPNGNDFDAVNTPFLAFAARCTSSFPFAFEPMTLAALTRLDVAGEAPGVLRWSGFFPNLPRAEIQRGDHVHRAFGDGGYLDNKPFTYVVETLSRRFSAVPLERKLLFVEPSPEQLAADDPATRPDPAHPPDALENSLAALTSIPRYETIREDLQAVLARNRRIERIERVVALGERSIELGDFARVLTAEGKVPDWSTLKLSDMVRYYGTAFLPYQRLRVYAATDSLADRLGAQWNIDNDSDQNYALRALVRAWRDRRYDDEGADGKETINAFLNEFDVDYRVRRLGFLLRKVDRMTRLFHKRSARLLDDAPPAPGMPPALSDEEARIFRGLPPPFTRLPATLTREQLAAAEQALRDLKRGLLDCRSQLLDAIRRFGQGAAAAARPADEEAEHARLRADLVTVLELVLGDESSEADVPANDGRGSVRAVLKEEARRMASATRTLQEAVAFRARALLEAGGAGGRVKIQDALVRQVEAMGVTAGGGPGTASGASPAAAPNALLAACDASWKLLGRPRLVVDGSGTVVASLDDADTSGLDPVLGAGLVALNSAEGRVLREVLCNYYLRFDTFDQMSFPLYYDTGTGEPSIVEVVRVSPVDATNLIDEKNDPQRRRKLAGTAVSNFGAFLDRRWRVNDIMWGRLDGAERLIQALLPMTDRDTALVRRELIERAHQGILREALMPPGEANLADMVVKALDGAPPSATTASSLDDQMAALWKGNADARGRLSELLVALQRDTALMTYVRKSRKIDGRTDPEQTLRSAARAVTITGRLLQGLSRRHGAGDAIPRWMARLGLVLQGVVAVSLPGTIDKRVWTHAVKLLYAFEVVLLGLSLVLGSADMRTLAITAFASTAGIHLVTLIIGDLAMAWKKRAAYAVVIGILAALVAFAMVGMHTAWGWIA